MTFLSIWLVTQALSVLLVWLFTIRLGRAPSLERTPSVAVIVAVKGHDHEFDEFLIRLFEQNYPTFRVIFAVETAADPAVLAIEKCRAIAPERVALVVAGYAVDEGQKTTNLRAAITALTSLDEILVFADADIWPEPDWLQRLVEPLVRGDADVVSGFTWLVVQDRRLSTFMLASMAASVVTIPRLSFLNALWGGSTAITRERFDVLDMEREWRGTLSDDLHFTNIVQQAGYDIGAPRELLPKTQLRTNGFADITVQARRWYMLVRVHMPVVYGLTVSGMTLVAAGWVIAVLGTLTGNPEALRALLLGLLLSVLRSCGRAVIVLRIFGKPGLIENTRFLLADPLLAPLAVIANAVLGWSALLMTRTTWAGISYRVTGPKSVEVLGRRAEG